MKPPNRPLPHPLRKPEGAARKRLVTGTATTAAAAAVADGEHDRALGLALRLLGRREHGRAELQAKLEAKGCPAQVVAQVLGGLQDNGAQSDARFAAALVRRRIDRGYGPWYIRAELKNRQVDEALVKDELNQPPAYWSEVAVRALAKRFPSRVEGEFDPTAEGGSYAARARFLSRRGFAPELIHRLLESREQEFSR